MLIIPKLLTCMLQCCPYVYFVNARKFKRWEERKRERRRRWWSRKFPLHYFCWWIWYGNFTEDLVSFITYESINIGDVSLIHQVNGFHTVNKCYFITKFPQFDITHGQSPFFIGILFFSSHLPSQKARYYYYYYYFLKTKVHMTLNAKNSQKARWKRINKYIYSEHIHK